MRIHMDDNKAVFLDRDGTINVDNHYVYRVADFKYIDGVLDALKELTNMGYILVVITNQSGIARGYYSEKEYIAIDEWMKKDLLDKGIKITKSYYCPHYKNGSIKDYSIECNCRKPKTGLFWKAMEELNINMNRSFSVGDKLRDLSVCKESGVKGILLSKKDTRAAYYDVCSNWNSIVKRIKYYDEKS